MDYCDCCSKQMDERNTHESGKYVVCQMCWGYYDDDEIEEIIKQSKREE